MNVAKIKGRMTERGYNNTSMAQKLNISRNTLISYFRNPGKMPYTILKAMAKALCDTEADVLSLFFAEDFRAA